MIDESVDYMKAEQNGAQKVCNFIKQLLQAGVGLYLVLLIVFYALYFVNGYEQLATHKFELLKFMSVCFGWVMIPFAVIYGLFYFVGQMETGRHQKKDDMPTEMGRKQQGKRAMFADRFLYEISLTDAAILDYTCVLLLSYFLSPYKEEALWGTAGWYMGLGTQLICVGIYFFTSRFFEADRIQDFLYFIGIVSFLFMLWGLLNRFSVYPIEMEYSAPSYISSMGNINWFCGYYSVFFCIGAVLYYNSEDIVVRLMGFIHATIAFALGAVEGSDSAFLSLGIFFFILFLYAFTETEKMKRFLDLVALYGMSCQVLRIISICFPESLNLKNPVIDFMLGNATLLVMLAAIALRVIVNTQDRIRGNREKNWISDYVKIRTVIIWLLILIGIAYIILLVLNTNNPGSIGPLSECSAFYFNATWGSNRSTTWRDGFLIFETMTPLQKIFGVGPDCFAIHASNNPIIFEMIEKQFGGNRLTNAHNEMITLLVNVGIWGLFTFCVAFISSVSRLIKHFPKRPMALIFIISICSYLIHNQFSFQQILNTPYIYMMLGLAECMMRNMREENSCKKFFD
ncbi:MAG: hypothetical protein E7299_01325 [Lachnospiraceae bacterium]|nr:hypothetical protein [Lachnospiraceae bacterium]